MVLMSRDNPKGWKLNDLMREVISDIELKTKNAQASQHVLKDKIINSNNAHISLLETVIQLNDRMYKELDEVFLNEGALKPKR